MRLAPFLLLIAMAPLSMDDQPWVELAGPSGLSAWNTPTDDWQDVGSVTVDPKDPKRLVGEPGSGAIFNGPKGRTRNLVSKDKFGDVEVHVEFLIPKGSNAGVKLHAQYEVQILDSHGKENPTASDCGGIYPRAELLPKYRYLDKGYPPLANACKPPGEWQTMDIVFRAPRFDDQGKKIANARFEKVVLNGTIVQKDLEVSTPTGHAYRNKEVAEGPILLQADHGPVAFRSVRVRRLSPNGATGP